MGFFAGFIMVSIVHVRLKITITLHTTTVVKQLLNKFEFCTFEKEVLYTQKEAVNHWTKTEG